MILTFTRSSLILPRLCARQFTAAAQEKFSEYGVVFDVLQKAPKDQLRVKFGEHSVNMGNELTAEATTSQPSLDWPAESNALYTITMVHPDAPSRKHPSAREWRHWLIVNAKGKNVSSGCANTSYEGPSPPPNSGLHRYVLLVYKQNGQISDTEWNDINRPNWSVTRFAAENKLGNPVAGNFFQVKG